MLLKWVNDTNISPGINATYCASVAQHRLQFMRSSSSFCATATTTLFNDYCTGCLWLATLSIAPNRSENRNSRRINISTHLNCSPLDEITNAAHVPFIFLRPLYRSLIRKTNPTVRLNIHAAKFFVVVLLSCALEKLIGPCEQIRRCIECNGFCSGNLKLKVSIRQRNKRLSLSRA